MPFAADLIVALVAGLLAFLAARWFVRSSVIPPRPAEEVARAVGEAVRPHSRLRRFLVRRLDRTVATGFLLTFAVAVAVLGGVALGVLALLVRRVGFINHIDRSVAAWGYDHRGASSTSALHAVTDLGSLQIVIALAVVVVAVDAFRSRSAWPFVFLLTVLAGEELAMHVVKGLVDRVRPTLNPAAASLGPSFPSGHSSTAAAFYAAAALIIGRRLSPAARQVVIALAVAIAVAVAASRVLLDFHWLSDVIGGLALGWGWFAVCSLLFGGRLLIPTAAVQVAAAEASAGPAGGRAQVRRLARPSREHP